MNKSNLFKIEYSVANLANISHSVRLTWFQYCLEEVLENDLTQCEVEFDILEDEEKTEKILCQLINVSLRALLIAKIDRIYLFIGIFNSVLNPFIYAFWNPVFYSELKNLALSIRRMIQDFHPKL